MRIAVVDDEKIYLDSIAEICRKFGADNGLDIAISEFTDGESFLDSLDNSRYNIVFMDVYMSGMNGVDTARGLRGLDGGCTLIFLTSSGEHMPEAFSCHAFEYIQKPFTERRVWDVLGDAMKIMPEQRKYMDLYSDRKTVRLLFDEIVSAVTDAHYLDIKTSAGKILRCRMTMSQFTEQADDSRFILINKGIVVNADHIIDFENNCCVLDNGSQFPMHVRNRLKIEQAVRNYNFDKIRSSQRKGR